MSYSKKSVDKFPPLLLVSLESQGFKLTWWARNADFSRIFPENHAYTFRFGTIEGLMDYQLGQIVLVAVINTEPHNGQFAKLMTKLEEIVRTFDLTLRIGEVWNARLKKHLTEKRGYKPDGKDDLILET